MITFMIGNESAMCEVEGLAEAFGEVLRQFRENDMVTISVLHNKAAVVEDFRKSLEVITCHE